MIFLNILGMNVIKYIIMFIYPYPYKYSINMLVRFSNVFVIKEGETSEKH